MLGKMQFFGQILARKFWIKNSVIFWLTLYRITLWVAEERNETICLVCNDYQTIQIFYFKVSILPNRVSCVASWWVSGLERFCLSRDDETKWPNIPGSRDIRVY